DCPPPRFPYTTLFRARHIADLENTGLLDLHQKQRLIAVLGRDGHFYRHFVKRLVDTLALRIDVHLEFRLAGFQKGLRAARHFQRSEEHTSELQSRENL